MQKCNYCGRENPDEAIYCTGCATGLQPEPPPIKHTRAGFWIRVAARLIDELLLIVLATITAYVVFGALTVATTFGWLSPEWRTRADGFTLLMFCLGFLANILYHTLCEGLHGATVGKLCFDLRVVTEDGRPARLKGAFIRSLAFILDEQFFGAVGYTAMRKSPLNQRYGDRWGKTAVLKTTELTPESRRTTLSPGAAIGLALAVDITLVTIGLLQKLL